MEKVGFIMFDRRNRIMIYIKLVITSAIFFSVINFSILILEKFSNNIFNTEFALNTDTLSLSYLIPLSLFFSLLMLSSRVYITKAIRIDNKEAEMVNIEQVLVKLRWKIKDQNQDTLIFKSPIALGLFMEEITVKFNDEEVMITGPSDSVKQAISRCKFLYTPYEIKNQKQEG